MTDLNMLLLCFREKMSERETWTMMAILTALCEVACVHNAIPTVALRQGLVMVAWSLIIVTARGSPSSDSGQIGRKHALKVLSICSVTPNIGV